METLSTTAEALITAMSDGSQEFILRAMATNYTEGHAWDFLDSDACRNAADEIRDLRYLLAKYGQTTLPDETCQHKRLTVDVADQTAKCHDCGADGDMQFVARRRITGEKE